MVKKLVDATTLDQLLQQLFPICRSITGDGLRQTLKIVQEYIPLEVHEIPSGTAVFDWTVPREWNIKGAYIKGPAGDTIVDFKKNNLHVMGYSTPIRTRMTLSELRPHLYSIPEKPDIIPYKTSYYKENWGFGITHDQLQNLIEGTYEVVIDSTLIDGSLTYGELYVQGTSANEVLISCYPCHPSMANDNLSGVVLTTLLAQHMLTAKPRYSYRFLFVPETIGAIAWLARNKENTERIKYGLVATCVGDAGHFTYKKSRRGNAAIDRIVTRVLKEAGVEHEIIDFFPLGSDERQYCSPGFDLPVGSLMRTMYYKFPQYHTSADDLSFVRGEHLMRTSLMYRNVFDAIERAKIYRNTNPNCEPQLGKRNLYEAVGGMNHEGPMQVLMWVLNLSDGTYSLEDIAERSHIDLKIITEASEVLLAHKLIEPIT